MDSFCNVSPNLSNTKGRKKEEEEEEEEEEENKNKQTNKQKKHHFAEKFVRWKNN